MVLADFTQIATLATCEFMSQLCLDKPEHSGILKERCRNHFQAGFFTQSLQLQGVKGNLRKELCQIYATLVKNLAIHYREFYVLQTTENPSPTTDMMYEIYKAYTDIQECLQSCISDAINRIEAFQTEQSKDLDSEPEWTSNS
jgi:hypothetical protein